VWWKERCFEEQRRYYDERVRAAKLLDIQIQMGGGGTYHDK